MYTPHNWVSEEIITADKLNNIETGIQNAEKEIQQITVKVVTKAQYDALTDKTGLYVIQG